MGNRKRRRTRFGGTAPRLPEEGQPLDWSLGDIDPHFRQSMTETAAIRTIRDRFLGKPAAGPAGCVAVTIWIALPILVVTFVIAIWAFLDWLF